MCQCNNDIKIIYKVTLIALFMKSFIIDFNLKMQKSFTT